MNHSERKERIEERRQRMYEHRRTQLLQTPLFSRVAKQLEQSSIPTLIFRDYKLEYANPEALTKMEYSYRQLDTFNRMELDTGPSKKRLDEILKFSTKAGIEDVEFNFTMPTLDRKVLLMSPQMHWFVAGGAEYWITELNGITKIDPASATGKVYSWLQRMFRRNVLVKDAPSHLDEAFAMKLISPMVDKKNNLLVTLDNMRKIDDEAVKMLGHYSTDPAFSDQIFITTRHPEIYHWVNYQSKKLLQNISPNCLYLPTELPKRLQPALVPV
jgi:hypothetical protein